MVRYMSSDQARPILRVDKNVPIMLWEYCNVDILRDVDILAFMKEVSIWIVQLGQEKQPLSAIRPSPYLHYAY